MGEGRGMRDLHERIRKAGPSDIIEVTVEELVWLRINKLPPKRNSEYTRKTLAALAKYAIDSMDVDGEEALRNIANTCELALKAIQCPDPSENSATPSQNSLPAKSSG